MLTTFEYERSQANSPYRVLTWERTRLRPPWWSGNETKSRVDQVERQNGRPFSATVLYCDRESCVQWDREEVVVMSSILCPAPTTVLKWETVNVTLEHMGSMVGYHVCMLPTVTILPTFHRCKLLYIDPAPTLEDRHKIP